ncbi:MAG TPA: acyl-CoA dehydrogenase family protein [Dehalococcoidia bacterium]|nr:acyl-CoA dehydrogenase family protein [Dehalococcoidia bacterium]
MIDFALSPEIRALRSKVGEFLQVQIEPNEPIFEREDDEAEALTRAMQAKARAMSVWAPHLPAEAGGMGIGFLGYAYLNEKIGRSFAAPRVFGCQAPDAGNMEILHLFGTPAQKERWLRPSVAGEIRSCFSMTEPEVSGADPVNLRTSAVRDGDEWVINGHKWFTSGAEGAAFAIVMCNTDPEAEPHRRMTQIIVPADSAGFEVIRAIPVMGQPGHGYGTHCEVRYNDVRVPVTNTLGAAGDGFLIAQKRLGPGRIHHCMRWLGQAQRALDLMCRRALAREVFGGLLADKETVQTWIADSVAEIQAARLLTMHAAWKIDQGQDARAEISTIKFYGAKVLHDVIDRAIQVHGALGVSGDAPLERMYRDARAARIYDGPDEVHRMVVARRVLRRYREGGSWEFEE